MNGSRHRLEISCPPLRAIARAQNFDDLCRRLNSDRIYELERLFGKLLGRNAHLHFCDESADTWPVFLEVRQALREAIEFTNYHLSSIYITGNELENKADVLSFLSAVDGLSPDAALANQWCVPMMKHVARLLRTFVVVDYQPDMEFAMDDCFTAKDLPLDPTPTWTEPFDVFISYKQVKYLYDANELCQALKRRKLSCFLDTEKLKLPSVGSVDRQFISSRLREALKLSRCTAFFESFDSATADKGRRGNHLLDNWTSFERRQSRYLVDVYFSKHEAEFFREGYRRSFWNIESLADLIADYCKTLPTALGPMPKPIVRRRRTFVQEMAWLEDKSAEFFESSVTVDPRAKTALLAPGDGALGSNPIVLGDDVLINLLRQSPLCAWYLHKSGLSFDELFLQGVKVTNGAWGESSSDTFRDVFGWTTKSAAAQAAEIARSGRLTEIDLLFAIFGFALEEPSSHPADLIRAAIEASVSESEIDGAWKALAELMTVAPEARHAASYIPSHPQWELTFEQNRWVLRAVAFCGAYEIASLAAAGSTPWNVQMRQDLPLFREFDLDDLAALLNGRVTEPLLEKWLRDHPEMELLFAVDSDVDQVTSVELAPVNGAPHPFFLTSVTDRLPADVDNTEPFSKRLLQAMNDFMAAQRQAVPIHDPAAPTLETAWRRPTILVGRRPAVDLNQRPKSTTLFDLQRTVLAPLHRIRPILEASFDDL
jgi:hypothetical protein